MSLKENVPAVASLDPAGITVKNLRAFFWLARLGNYHAVADRLRVSQPAVTSRIASLEDELGVRLFSRGSRTVEITPEGKEALRLCEPILTSVDRMVERFSDTSDPIGIVRIGVVDTIARTWLPNVLETMQVEYPNIELEIANESTLILHDLLTQGNLSMAISINPCDHVDVKNSELSRYQVEWVASPGLVDPDRTYSVSELMALPLIGYIADSPPEVWLRNNFDKSYFGKTVRNTTNSMSTMIWLAENGLGIAAIPPNAIRQHLAENRLTIVRTTRSFDRMPFYLNCRTRPFSPVVQTVARTIEREARRFDEAKA